MIWLIKAGGSAACSTLWWTNEGWNLLEERASQFSSEHEARDMAATLEHRGADNIHVIPRASPIPRLDIVCDHRGGPYEYHCAECCPGAAIGRNGTMEPCNIHKEGSALMVLEERRVADGARLASTFRSVDEAERFALDILASVGAARRGNP